MLLGAHVSSAGGIYQAVGRATEMGCRSLQVFPQSPRVWKPGVHSDEDLARFREEAVEAELIAMCHAPYLINLAGTDPLTVERSEAVLAQALRTSRGLGALAVVVHLGSRRPCSSECWSSPATAPGSCSRTRQVRAAPWASRSRSWRS